MAVSSQLRRLSDAALERGATGVVLGGSVAIGWEHQPRGGQARGDIDLYIGYASRAVAKDASQSGTAASVDGREIHVSSFTRSQMSRSPHTFRLFEVRERGVLVCGANIREWIPEVTIDTLEVGDLNDIVLWRLADLYAAWWHFVTQGDRDGLGYAAAKNLLDLSTWAFPHARRLTPGMDRRMEEAPHIKSTGVVDDVIRGFVKYGTSATQVKRGLAQAGEGADLFHDVLTYYCQAATAILDGDTALCLGTQLGDSRVRRRAAARARYPKVRSLIALTGTSPISFVRAPHRAVLEALLRTSALYRRRPDAAHMAATLVPALFR